MSGDNSTPGAVKAAPCGRAYGPALTAPPTQLTLRKTSAGIFKRAHTFRPSRQKPSKSTSTPSKTPFDRMRFFRYVEMIVDMAAPHRSNPARLGLNLAYRPTNAATPAFPGRYRLGRSGARAPSQSCCVSGCAISPTLTFSQPTMCQRVANGQAPLATRRQRQIPSTGDFRHGAAPRPCLNLASEDSVHG
jgi:hypothetical protein